jgi:hypothetical protein
MYSGDFLFNVSREFVSKCQMSLFVLLGNDLHYPVETSRELAARYAHRALERTRAPPGGAAGGRALSG